MAWVDPLLYFLLGALGSWPSPPAWVAPVLGGLVALKAWRSTGSSRTLLAAAEAKATQQAASILQAAASDPAEAIKGLLSQ